MKKLILAGFLAFFGTKAIAQDTTWVQTFTFDSIETRRADFTFPASLEGKRFEKVLMYYKLKCSPLTTWDQYDCGEWDYLTYTRIFDHTGVFDSVRVNGMHYAVNTLTPQTYSYNTTPAYDVMWKAVQNRSAVATTPYSVGGSANPAPVNFMEVGKNGHRMQWILTAAELTAAIGGAGPIEGIDLNALAAGTVLPNLTISMGATALNTLSSWQTSGLTMVYNSDLMMVPGVNSVIFGSPFVWDGTSNVIIEMSYEDGIPAASLVSLSAVDSPNASTVLEYSGDPGVFRTDATNYADLNLSNVDLGGDLTIAFWSKGNATAGTNTSVLEAVDSLGNRILNIHMPWSDNTFYFDAGSGGNYDRISKAASLAEIDNTWNHWAFVKKSSTGQMMIYKNGSLWHSGTGFTDLVGKISKFYLGTGVTGNYQYKGDIDEFSVWSTALDVTTISTWMNRKIDASHPDYSALELYYDFDDVLACADKSGNNRLAMCSADGMIVPSASPVTGFSSGTKRPELALLQGTCTAAVADSIPVTQQPEPKVLFEYMATDNNFAIVDNQLTYDNTSFDTLAINGSVLNSVPVALGTTITNDTIHYFREPFELVNDVEIGRYITPYGIGFNLGPQGFTWIYDVTDYQKYLRGTVDLAAHNTQELIDLRFAFIEGTPPRDVHNVEPIWSNFRSYQYGDMDNDNVLSATTKILSDTSETFKIKSRFTGHGHNGSTNCCEWDPKDHQIFINGVPRFTWDIWEETGCGENPNIGQGGTWPYAREGWCPGDMVKEYDHEITPYVQSGDTIEIDYDIEDVPVNDQAQANGNYVVALDLVSYSGANFQHDAAIVDVLNPNKWEYYSKWNPTCSNPRVMLQNTGEQPLTQCTIRCWVTYGNWQDFEWTGNLGFLEKEMVEIPITDQNWWFGANPDDMFHAQVFDVEGSPNQDEYEQNNLFKTKYQAPEFINGPFYVYFKTNNKANENSWKLIDASGTTIFERTTLLNSTEYRDTFDLAPGCYSVILEDTDHDGIGFWYSSQVEGETAGQFRLRYVNGGVIESFTTDFGKYHRYDFSIGYAVGTEDKGQLDEGLQVFPNPGTDVVTTEFNGNLGDGIVVTMVDGNGRKVRELNVQSIGSYFTTDIPVADLQKGMYFIQAQGSLGKTQAKFIKE